MTSFMKTTADIDSDAEGKMEVWGYVSPENVERSEMLFYPLPWGNFLKKINFGKGQNVKNINKNYFNFLSHNAGVNGNVRHTLTLCPLSS